MVEGTGFFVGTSRENCYGPKVWNIWVLKLTTTTNAELELDMGLFISR